MLFLHECDRAKHVFSFSNALSTIVKSVYYVEMLIASLNPYCITLFPYSIHGKQYGNGILTQTPSKTHAISDQTNAVTNVKERVSI